MTDDNQTPRTEVQKGYRPQPGDVGKYGYRPRDQKPVNSVDLKPPSGGTAVDAPKDQVPEDSK